MSMLEGSPCPGCGRTNSPWNPGQKPRGNHKPIGEMSCPSAGQDGLAEASTGGCPELSPAQETLAQGCGCPPVILCFPPSALAQGHPSVSLPAPAEPSPTADTVSLEKLLSALYYLVIIFPLKPEISKA